MNSTKSRSSSVRVIASLLLVLLALGVAGCAVATSAPSPAAAPAATEATDPARAAVGIYKSIIPGASSPGIDGTLYLNYDGTMREVDNYLNEDPNLVEVGTWTASEDGNVIVTATGQEDRPYDQPRVTTMRLEGPVLSTVPAADGSPTMMRTWYEFGALAMGELQMPFDTEAAEKAAANGFADFYKAFLPSATCCGRDILLSLQLDGVAVMKTDFLNGEPPIEEIGTWETIGEDTVRVTLNSRQESVYETPEVHEYQWQDGALRSQDGLVLRSVFGYAMPVLAQWANETASFVTVDEGGLNEQALSNATYELPDLGSFALHGGQYEMSTGAGASQVVQAFYQTAAFGDLDGDGVGDAAVVIATQTGGSGSFYYLVAMADRDGQPVQLGQEFLGDRVQVISMEIRDGAIIVDMKVSAPDDPLCCPSSEVQRVYQLADGVLTMVEESAS